MAYVEYSSNNSGGHWWLNDDDWKALSDAGWRVVHVWESELFDDDGNYVFGKDGLPIIVSSDKNNSKYSLGAIAPGERWLGAIAKTAYRANVVSLRDAAAEWEKITGQSSTDAGCPCCGQPHNFTLYDENGDYVESGPNTSYEASW